MRKPAPSERSHKERCYREPLEPLASNRNLGEVAADAQLAATEPGLV
ncbi:MAG: hypothetical protein ACI91B_003672, partial [Planctomycetota bacterium]